MYHRVRCRLWQALLVFVAVVALWGTSAARAEEDSVVRLVYFTADTCPHCSAVVADVLAPLQTEYGDRVEIKVVEISEPSHYEMLIRAEEMFGVSSEERGLPTLIADGVVLVGEIAIREQLQCLLDTCLANGGIPWPDIPGLGEVAPEGGPKLELAFDLTPDGGEICSPDEVAVCEAPHTIWAAYFYEVGCQECSRAEYDIRYAQSQYPQLVVEEFSVQDDAALAEWLANRTGVPERQHLATPAIFIGDAYLIGGDITSEALMELVEVYAATGVKRAWDAFNRAEAEETIVQRFLSFGALTVAFAGLVDGLNPCAFATLVFFVSYLTLSGHRGRQVLAVGAAFTLGVFLAYLAVGLGFYRVLDLMGGLLDTLGRWIYGLTALMCAALAVFSFVDALKARRGDVGDMTLGLPHGLRMRINATIRRGRSSRAFVVGGFITGVVVSFLELACTGQAYLPTIVFMVSRPEMQSRAVSFLVLYNVLFILPLVAVFWLVYLGAGSKQLSSFLQRRAAAVKFGMSLLFAALAAWLLVSVLLV